MAYPVLLVQKGSEKGMTFNRGGVVISVDKIYGFGKMPGLYVGNKNKLFKVASFGNDKKAETFCQYLEYIAGITNEPPKEDA